MGDIGIAISQKQYDVKTAADRFLLFNSAFRSLKILQTYAVTTTIPNGNFGEFTSVNTSTNVINDTAHGLSNGQLVNFTTSGTLPGGIGSWDDGFFYYVINATTNTFQISETSGGSAVDITSSGSGTHTWYTDTNKIVITHSLGYFSPWIFVYNGSTSAGQGTSAFMSDSTFPLDIRIYENTAEIYVTSDFDSAYSSIGDTVYFSCYQFIDTFDSYTSDVISTDTTTTSNGTDYGFRSSKSTKDVKECDDIDLIASSSFFTSIVQKKGIDTTGSVSHSLSYIPSYLGFIKRNGKTYLALANDSVSVTTSTLETVLDTGDSFYYVIFKAKSV